MANGKKSAAIREMVALSIASGRTVKDAAISNNVSIRAVAHWLKHDPPFVQRVDSLRADMISRAAGRIANDMTSAAKTLRKLLRDPDSRVRLGAARAVLENGVRLRENTVLEARIVELEKAAAARKEKRP
jgi:uncharacterized membrane-anchored protein YjiN (DUF445 family)